MVNAMAMANAAVGWLSKPAPQSLPLVNGQCEGVTVAGTSGSRSSVCAAAGGGTSDVSALCVQAAAAAAVERAAFVAAALSRVALIMS